MISVVIVNFNGGRAVVENLRVIAERLPAGPSEIIVVDNASTDGSPDLIRRELPDLRLVSAGANRGYAAGVNLGLNAASGTTLVVMNPDVVPEPGALERLAEAVRQRRDFAVLGGSVIDGDGRVSSNCFRALPVPSDILRDGFFLRPRVVPRRGELEAPRDDVVATEVVSGSVMALRRDSLDELGPMDEDFFLYREDVEWCHRAARKGMRVGVVPGARFAHEGGASTRAAEGPAFAARVLADFQYFHQTQGIPASRVRRLWMLVLWFRATLYGLDARLSIIGRRPGSRRRAAIYRMLRRRLRKFVWTAVPGQNGHPSRLGDLPVSRPRRDGDSRPRILLIIPDMDHGGSQRRVEYLVTGPLAERFDFEILCLRSAGRIGERLRGLVPLWEVGVDDWRGPATWRQVRDFCELLEPDLVHSSTFPGDLGAWAGFRGRVPWISAKVSIDTWMSPPVRLLERLVVRRADVVYAVADEVARAKSHLGRLGMLPLVITNPPMIPFSDDEPRGFPAATPVRLVCIGRLERVKRVGDFLLMASVLARSHPGRFTFSVIGDGSLMDELKAQASALGVAAEFQGAVLDVAAALDAADIVLLFSAGEGSPNTVLETIARGRVPVVRRAAGTTGTVPSVLGRCLVDSSSPEAFAERVLDVVSRSDEYLSRVREARDLLRQGRDTFDSAMEKLYMDALPPPGGDGRLRVLHLITRLIVGGAQENTIASVERVDPERYDSQLWIGPQTGSEGSLLADARSRGIVVRVLPNLVREINPRRDALALVQLVRLLRREQFDIVHTHSSKAGILGRLAAKVAGVPHIVHTVHGWGFHDRMNPLLKNTYVTLEKMLQPWTRPLISVSNKTTRVGLDEGIGRPGAYRLIRSGIPLLRFFPDPKCGSEVRERLGLSADDIVVGSVGRLSPQKNPRDFVRVAELLSRGRENLRFVYVGDGPMRTEIERTLDSVGLSDRVLLLGIRDDVPDLLRAMDVFILTSLWEGLPRVVLQALATGLPVVAYDTAGIGEAVKEGQNGHLVEPGAVGQMVELLDRLAGDASLRAAMGRAAAEELDTAFTEDGMIRDLENLYDELTKGEGGGVRSAGKRPQESQCGLEGDDRGAS